MTRQEGCDRLRLLRRPSCALASEADRLRQQSHLDPLCGPRVRPMLRCAGDGRQDRPEEGRGEQGRSCRHAHGGEVTDWLHSPALDLGRSAAAKTPRSPVVVVSSPTAGEGGTVSTRARSTRQHAREEGQREEENAPVGSAGRSAHRIHACGPSRAFTVQREAPLDKCEAVGAAS